MIIFIFTFMIICNYDYLHVCVIIMFFFHIFVPNTSISSPYMMVCLFLNSVETHNHHVSPHSNVL